MNKSNQPQLIYIAYGTQTYQTEAFFSIASALAHSQEGPLAPAFEIQVFTDNPSYYAKLPVVTHSIPSDWRGPHDYHFRNKHCALREVLTTHTKAALIDTDTFFHSAPEKLLKRIDDEHLLCNAIGHAVTKHEELPVVQRARQLDYIGKSMRTTNSGVIGLTQKNRSMLDLSIDMMDNLYPEFKSFYTLEEFCIAMAASKPPLDLHECPDLIHHYWSRKLHFRAKINTWHLKHSEAPLNHAALADIEKINHRLPKPAQPQRALQKICTQFLPKQLRQFARELLYGCSTYGNEFDQACSTVWWDKALENFHNKPNRTPAEKEINHWLIQLLAGRHRQALNQHLAKRLKENQQ